MFCELRDKFNVLIDILKKRRCPNSLSITPLLATLRYLGMKLAHPKCETYSFLLYNKVVTAGMYVFVLTALLGLYDALSNVEDFVECCCISYGLILIMIKSHHFQKSRYDIQRVINIFSERQSIAFARGSEESKERYLKYYVDEAKRSFCMAILGFTLFIALDFQPLFSGSYSLPYRAKYPFATETGSVAYVASYIFQSVFSLCIISYIVCTDTIGVTFLSQTTLQLEELCADFEKLRKNAKTNKNATNELRSIVQEHQFIISLLNYINQINYSTSKSQVVCSTCIICMTAFEATLTQNLSSRLKFLCYLVASLIQILEWCWYGNMVSYQSTKIGAAAYDCLWIDCSERFKKDILLILLRSQKPLAVKALPFYDFNLESFQNILASSYTYFTVLRSLNS